MPHPLVLDIHTHGRARRLVLCCHNSPQEIPKKSPSFLKTSRPLVATLLSHERRGCKRTASCRIESNDATGLRRETFPTGTASVCGAVPHRGGRGAGALCGTGRACDVGPGLPLSLPGGTAGVHGVGTDPSARPGPQETE